MAHMVRFTRRRVRLEAQGGYELMSLLKNRVKINVPFSVTGDEYLRQTVEIIWTSRKNRFSRLCIDSLSQCTTVECRRQPKVAVFSSVLLAPVHDWRQVLTPRVKTCSESSRHLPIGC